MIKSQTGSATVVLFAALFVSSDSVVVVFTVTTLVILPSAMILVTKTRETGSLAFNWPISHILVSSSKLPTEWVS